MSESTKKLLNLLKELEIIRRIVSRKPNCPTIFFRLRNIDLRTLQNLYPSYVPNRINDLVSDPDLANTIFPDFEIDFQSPVFVNHPLLGKFNVMAKEFAKSSSGQVYTRNSKQNHPGNAVDEIGSTISADIRSQFIKSINIERNIFEKFEPHIDTLFFVCLYFFNQHWDAYGVDFNGAISTTPVSNLNLDSQPFEYRAITQVKFLSSILYNHFSLPNKTDELSISTISDSCVTKDPILLNWFIDSMLKNSLPISTSTYGFHLTTLLNSTKDYYSDEFLKNLKVLTELEHPNYHGAKGEVIKKFCWDIHLIFSHYLALDSADSNGKRAFNGKRLLIYKNVLKCFQMDDFDNPKHRHDRTTNTKRDEGTNRLGDLLRKP